jgi:hypothetical protein
MSSQLDINPHDGVGPVKLGMTRSAVKLALSTEEDHRLDQSSSETSDYAFGNSLQIEYDNAGHVQFIGVGFYDDCGCDYWFADRHIAEYEASELFALLSKLDKSNPEFTRSEHCFETIGIVVSGADPQYDYLGDHQRPVYGQVSVVNQQYFDAVAAIASATT